MRALIACLLLAACGDSIAPEPLTCREIATELCECWNDDESTGLCVAAMTDTCENNPPGCVVPVCDEPFICDY